MCGIVGVYQLSSVSSIGSLSQRMTSAVESLVHRGPDKQSVWSSETLEGIVMLGHTRLSIIDLSDAGSQPFFSDCGRYAMVFNGEIYNYVELRHTLRSLGYSFKTDTDTEVLLAGWIEWGEKILPKLDGMFAIAIYDTLSNVITLIRDAFGIKPLYVYHSNHTFAFASEISALKRLVGRRLAPDLTSAYQYIVFGLYDYNDSSFISEIKKISPGSIVKYCLSSLSRVQRHWWNPSIQLRKGLSFQDACEKLRNSFLESLSRQLRTDVPWGVALSGGIDSSVIACGIRHLYPDIPINTYSYFDIDEINSEAHWINYVNSFVKAVPHAVSVCSDDLFAEIDDLIISQGEPFGGLSIYAQRCVFRRASDTGVKVILSGQGADEMLAGYDGYPRSHIQSLIEKYHFRELLEYITFWPGWPGRSKRRMLSLLMQLMLPEYILDAILSGSAYRSTSKCISYDYFKDANICFLYDRPLRRGEDGYGRRLVEHLRNALTDYGVSANVRDADRDSMRWSIECRVPFLSVPLASLTLGLPEEYLVSTRGSTKHILRESMRGIVPDKILFRRDKIGFRAGQRSLLRGNPEKVLSFLSDVSHVPFLNYDGTARLFREFLSSNSGSDLLIWRIMCYARWFSLQGFS
jgi:asparagine synthase (glutamine-hydrolysing)